jgi:PAS domain S-box-containing protein
MKRTNATLSARAIEPKSNEKSPAVSEQAYRDLADHAATGMATVDVKGRFTYVNQVMADFMGHSTQDLMGRPFKDYIHPEDRGRITSLFLKAVLLRRPLREVELRAMGSEGSVRHLLMRPSPMRAGGKTIGFSAVMIDITERKRMEDRLRASEERYRSLVERMHDALLVFGEDRRIEFANTQVEAFVGYKPEEIIGEKFDKLLTPEGMKGIVERYEKRRRGEPVPSSYELQAVAKDGTVKDFEISAALYTIDGKPKTIAAFKDITERKRMEKTLRRSEERFRKVFQFSPIPYLITVPEGPIVDVNDAWVRMSGYSREEAIGRSTIELGMVPDPEQRNQLVRDLLQKRRLNDVEITRRTKSGELRDLLNSPELVEIGGQTCILNMQVDITERKRMEKELERHAKRLEELVEDRTKELKESEEKFRRISEASLDAIYTTSLDGEILDMNPAGVSMFGFESLDELKKVNIRSLYVNPNDRMRLIELSRKGPVRGFETRLRGKDGKIVDVLMNNYALRDGDGGTVGFQGALTNVTERKELERIKDQVTSSALVEIAKSRELEKMKEQLMASVVADITRQKELEKMKDQFISAVTHELRTPLVSIKGYIDYVVSGELGSLPAEVASSLNVAKRNTDRLISLTNDLLDVQRLQAGRLQLNVEPLNLQQVLAQCVQEIKLLIDQKKQRLNLVVEENLPVQGDPVRLSQVLVNLLVNASKFTPGEGVITLRARVKDDTIEVQVSDTGIGIREQDLMRVFEPFAAIEKPSYIEGTGLGLSITKGLVEAHGGKIWAESPGEGKGATFTFLLPKWKEAA